MSTFTMVLGGARSGKSRLAVRRGLAHERDGGDVTFVATSPRIPGDRDLDDRIARHQAERPATWRTVEEQIELAGVIRDARPDDLLIVDCVTLWVSNLVVHGADEDAVDAATDRTLAAIGERSGPTLAVSNEVGLGIVPDNELSRRYRDLLGRVNRRLVADSDDAFFLVAGRAIRLTELDEP